MQNMKSKKKIPIKVYRKIEELIDEDWNGIMTGGAGPVIAELDLNCAMTAMEKYYDHRSEIFDEFYVRTWREWKSDQHEKYWTGRLEMADVNG